MKREYVRNTTNICHSNYTVSYDITLNIVTNLK